MMENYEFYETGSRSITQDGEHKRTVSFRGSEKEYHRNDRLDVSGTFTMPEMEYFQAGMDGNIDEVIRSRVVERLTPEEETQEPTQ